MAENEQNLVTFKIRSEDLEWAGGEQRRIRKAENRKISQAGLFTRLRGVYEAAMSGAPASEGIASPTYDQYEITQDELKWLQLIRAADRAAHGKVWRGLVDAAKILLVEAAKTGTRTKE